RSAKHRQAPRSELVVACEPHEQVELGADRAATVARARQLDLDPHLGDVAGLLELGLGSIATTPAVDERRDPFVIGRLDRATVNADLEPAQLALQRRPKPL